MSDLQKLKNVQHDLVVSMVYELKNDIRKHAGEQKQYDDITLLSIRRKENPLQEKHCICRATEKSNPGELMDFVEAAAIESKLIPEEAISLRSATDIICKNLFQSGQNKNKPDLFSLFFEREAEKISVIIRDDGAPMGEKERNTMEAELQTMKSGHESREPGMIFDTLTHEMMERGGNKLSLHLTRKAGENNIS